MTTIDLGNTENRLLGTVLTHYAATIPDRCFLRTETESVSYREMLHTAQTYGAGLQAMGLSSGDRICLLMDSCIDYVALTLAANLIGVIWIPVNTDYRGEWLETTLTDSDPALLICDAQFNERVDATACSTLKRINREALAAELAQAGSEPTLPQLHYGDTASVMWTSGTTGKAKGVMQSHNAWIRSSLSAAEMGKMATGDVAYNVLPLHNSAAWVTNIYPALLTGATCAMDPMFSASNFWERTRHFSATHTFTLGAMHMFLWAAPPREDDKDNPVRSTNMVPMPDEIREPFKQRFGIDEIHQGFGQSEVMLLMRRPDWGDKTWPPNALGTVASDIEIMLQDDEGKAVAQGEAGELCVKEKEPHVLFNGYFNNPEANETAFRGGWYHTGDLLRQGEDHNYFFVDRKSDLIRYKGRSVSSLAVEAIASRHPEVESAAAYGIPSAELTSEHEIMLAAICSSGASITPRELAEFINAHAPYYFVPRYIDFVDVLPVTPTQKVQKKLLRERGVTATTWDAQAEGFVASR